MLVIQLFRQRLCYTVKHKRVHDNADWYHIVFVVTVPTDGG